jgi:hypothetical protein
VLIVQIVWESEPSRISTRDSRLPHISHFTSKCQYLNMASTRSEISSENLKCTCLTIFNI